MNHKRRRPKKQRGAMARGCKSSGCKGWKLNGRRNSKRIGWMKPSDFRAMEKANACRKEG